MKRILFVEDDLDYQSVVAELLRIEGYEVVTAPDATEGVEAFKEESFDLVLSDLKMGGIDGLIFLVVIRKLNPKIKVIILTGEDDDASEIRGLELSVNDYLKKPIAFDVLLKRIERIILQDEKTEQGNYIAADGNLVINPKTREITVFDEQVDLTVKEYDLLLLFLNRRNEVLTRKVILKEVWLDTDELQNTRTVDTHIKKLRAKLGLTNIYSIRGVGYQWVEE